MKKFSKNDFLETNLFNFLFWRETNLSKKLNKKTEQGMNYSTLFSKKKSFNNQQKLNIINSSSVFSLKEYTNTVDIQVGKMIANFFPNKKAFMHYWLWPFIGLAGYLCLTKSPLEKSIKYNNIFNHSNLSNQKNQFGLIPIYNKNNTDSLFHTQFNRSETTDLYIDLKSYMYESGFDETLNELFLKMQKLEKQEFQNLWKSYFISKKFQIQRTIYPTFVKNEVVSTLDIESKKGTFLNPLYQTTTTFKEKNLKNIYHNLYDAKNFSYITSTWWINYFYLQSSFHWKWHVFPFLGFYPQIITYQNLYILNDLFFRKKNFPYIKYNEFLERSRYIELPNKVSPLSLFDTYHNSEELSAISRDSLNLLQRKCDYEDRFQEKFIDTFVNTKSVQNSKNISYTSLLTNTYLQKNIKNMNEYEPIRSNLLASNIMDNTLKKIVLSGINGNLSKKKFIGHLLKFYKKDKSFFLQKINELTPQHKVQYIKSLKTQYLENKNLIKKHNNKVLFQLCDDFTQLHFYNFSHFINKVMRKDYKKRCLATKFSKFLHNNNSIQIKKSNTDEKKDEFQQLLKFVKFYNFYLNHFFNERDNRIKNNNFCSDLSLKKKSLSVLKEENQDISKNLEKTLRKLLTTKQMVYELLILRLLKQTRNKHVRRINSIHTKNSYTFVDSPIQSSSKTSQIFSDAFDSYSLYISSAPNKTHNQYIKVLNSKSSKDYLQNQFYTKIQNMSEFNTDFFKKIKEKNVEKVLFLKPILKLFQPIQMNFDFDLLSSIQSKQSFFKKKLFLNQNKKEIYTNGLYSKYQNTNLYICVRNFTPLLNQKVVLNNNLHKRKIQLLYLKGKSLFFSPFLDNIKASQNSHKSFYLQSKFGLARIKNVNKLYLNNDLYHRPIFHKMPSNIFLYLDTNQMSQKRTFLKNNEFNQIKRTFKQKINNILFFSNTVISSKFLQFMTEIKININILLQQNQNSYKISNIIFDFQSALNNIFLKILFVLEHTRTYLLNQHQHINSSALNKNDDALLIYKHKIYFSMFQPKNDSSLHITKPQFEDVFYFNSGFKPIFYNFNTFGSIYERNWDKKSIPQFHMIQKKFLRLKNQFQRPEKFLIFKTVQNRKQEKIFRDYLSYKFNSIKQKKIKIKENQIIKYLSKNTFEETCEHKSNLRFLYLRKTLKNLKNKLHISKSFYKSIYIPFRFSIRNYNCTNVDTNQASIEKLVSKEMSNDFKTYKYFATNKHDASFQRNNFIQTQFNNNLNFSPNTLLRRIGFLFMYQSEKINPRTYDKNVDTLNRVDRHQYIQKKRRGKKRKRFYPRPIWSNFLLYKKFLMNRYFSLKKGFNFNHFFVQNTHILNSNILNSRCRINTNQIHQMRQMRQLHKNFYNNESVFLKNTKLTSFNKQDTILTDLSIDDSKQYLNNFFILKSESVPKKVKRQKLLKEKWKNKQFSTKIYRNNKQQWGYNFQNIPQLEKFVFQKTSFISSLRHFNHHKYYLISREILNDFQRLCWKSYWLRSALTPYIRRIKKNQFLMREMEKKSQILTLIDKIKNFSFVCPSIKDSFSFRKNKMHANVNMNSIIDTSYKDYLSIDDNLNSKYLFIERRKLPPLLWYLNMKNSSQQNFSTSNFLNFKAIYEKAEYDRLLYERLSDVIQNIKTNLNTNNNPERSADILNTNRLDIHKEQFSAPPKSFKRGRRKQEKIYYQNFWSRFALTINEPFNFNQICAFSLTSFGTPSIKPYGELPTLRSLWALNQTNLLSNIQSDILDKKIESHSGTVKQSNEMISLWSTLKLRDQNISNKTNKFFSRLWNQIFPQTIKKLSSSKISIGEKKLSYSGLNFKNQKINLRFLKFQLKDRSDFDFLNQRNKEKMLSPKLLSKQQYFYFLKNPIYKNNEKESAKKDLKRSIHFWWSFKSFYSDWIFSDWNQSEFNNFSLLNFNILNSQMHHMSIFSFLAILTTCTILFHICSFFSLIQISEIRSFIKLYILILYKLSNFYFVVIYSILNLFQNYFKHIFVTVKEFKPSLIHEKSSFKMPEFEDTCNIQFLLKQSTNKHGQNDYQIIFSKKQVLSFDYSSSLKINNINLKYLSKIAMIDTKRQFQPLLKDIFKANRLTTNKISFGNLYRNSRPKKQSKGTIIDKEYKDLEKYIDMIDNVQKNSKKIQIYSDQIKPETHQFHSIIVSILSSLRKNISLSLSIFDKTPLQKKSVSNSLISTPVNVYTKYKLLFSNTHLKKISRYIKMMDQLRDQVIQEIDSIYRKHNVSLKTQLRDFNLLEICFYFPNIEKIINNSLLESHIYRDKKNSFHLSREYKQQNSYLQKYTFDAFDSRRFMNTKNTNFIYSNDELHKVNLFLSFKKTNNQLFSSSKNFKNFAYFLYKDYFLFYIFNRFNRLNKYRINLDIQVLFKHFQIQSKHLFQNRLNTIQNLFSLFIFYTLKSSIFLTYNCFGVCSSILFKTIDLLESLMLIIYKFLEKPAEFMIDWVAQFFFIEWSSNIISIIPESFDIYTWRTFTKFFRGSRVFSLFGFLVQRRLWCFFEIFIYSFIKSDADLMSRQKKGLIFWDIWAEILMMAAEKYKINLSSLITIKEEQDLFLERLLDDPKWFYSWSTVKVTSSNLFDSSLLLKEDKKQVQHMKKPISVIEEKRTQVLADLSGLANISEVPISWNNGLWSKINKEQNNFKNFIFDVTNNKKNSPQNLYSYLYNFDTTQEYKESNYNRNIWRRWSANQYLTHQGIDTDLFIDVHPPKSFSQLSLLKSTHAGSKKRNIYIKSLKSHVNNNLSFFQRKDEPLSFSQRKDEPNQLLSYSFEQNTEKMKNLSNRSGLLDSGLQTLGLLTCQIYSGLFSTQVSKNILVVGAGGNRQNLLIYALAGETELKMILDNAYRYAHIQRGVAVGMKLLRDVFDSLTLHTPCLFLMEDIHVIGERRPMFISENENPQLDPIFSGTSEEVHEKNQIIYRFNKHIVSDFRKPYKGDFSVTIPTNHFCFSLFLGVSPPKIRKNSVSKRNPLLISSDTSNINTDFGGDSLNLRNQKTKNLLFTSVLQLPLQKFFVPPATSPFRILGMKEQRKFKPNKLVKEIPWGGISTDQTMLIPKMIYSVRVKVAFLADMAINQLGVKLDMITDLLVIMDNVRSNRGFVVFATTHVPFLLDPALRRPGRFDETISFSLLHHFINRIEFLKTELAHYSSTFDFFDYSFLVPHLNETDLSNFTSKTKLLLFNVPYNIFRTINANVTSIDKQNVTSFYNNSNFVPQNFIESNNLTNEAYGEKISQNYIGLSDFSLTKNLQFISRKKFVLQPKIISSINDATKFSKQAWIESQKIFHKKQKILSHYRNRNDVANFDTEKNQNSETHHLKNDQQLSINNKKKRENKNSLFIEKKIHQSGDISLLNLLKINAIYQTSSFISYNILALTYSHIGKFMIQSQILSNNTCFRSLFLNENQFLDTDQYQENKESIYQNLYSSPLFLQNRLMHLLSDRIGEFFLFNHSYQFQNKNFENQFKPSQLSMPSSSSQMKKSLSTIAKDSIQNNTNSIDKSLTHSLKSILTTPGIYNGLWNFSLPVQGEIQKNSKPTSQESYDKFWSSATSFVFSFVQKRFLFSKHILATKSIDFRDLSILKEPPSPPTSSIVMPARKFENLKRTEYDFQQKNVYSILEKIQIHQQQRLMKNLYEKPVILLFRSQMVKNRLTHFSHSIKELGYYDSFMKKSSSINCYYKNRILTRQRFSIVNQWWSGQLAEHNLEKTFSSDVDWRSMFVESFGDLIIDFPDADQYYNPKRRRWFLQSAYGGYWHTLEKIIPYEIYYHFMILSFNKAFNYLNTEREILDDFAYSYLQKGFLKEIDLITNLSRFDLYSKNQLKL